MIATRMKVLRGVLGLSMPEFGRRLGCSRDVIANLEYGRVEPKEVFLTHICDIYGARRAWLFEGEGAMFVEEPGDQRLLEATAIFRSLPSDLQGVALAQLRSLQKLTEKYSAAPKGGVRNNLDTIRLMAAMTEAREFGELKDKTGRTVMIGEYLRGLMNERGMPTEDLTASSGLKLDELTRLLDSGSGVSRDTLLACGLALSLDVEAMQRLLTAAGLPALYAKNQRDSACMFALMKGLTVAELNELLAELEETVL